MIIRDYEEFILEKQISLLLESHLYASDDFLKRLKKIKSNKIADILYQLFDNMPYVDKSLNQNYIDIGGEDDITFISDTRIDRLSSTENDVDGYSARGRGSVKIGRFASSFLRDEAIKKLLPNFSFTDKDIEEFVNLYKASDITKLKKFKIVKGDKIPKWYHYEKYAYSDQKGTLGSSCMNDVNSSFFKIYEKNPEVCNLLILKDENNKLIGRALVWKLSKSPCEAEYFMDRVYTANDSDVIKFINYAKNKGWLYKYKMSADLDESVLFYYNGTPVIGKIVVDLKEIEFNKYPFLDTLCFLNKKNKTLSNVAKKKDNVLSNTDGSLDKNCFACDGDGKGVGKNEKCDSCCGILEGVIKQIKKGKAYPEYANYLPK